MRSQRWAPANSWQGSEELSARRAGGADAAEATTNSAPEVPMRAESAKQTRMLQEALALTATMRVGRSNRLRRRKRATTMVCTRPSIGFFCACGVTPPLLSSDFGKDKSRVPNWLELRASVGHAGARRNYDGLLGRCRARTWASSAVLSGDFGCLSVEPPRPRLFVCVKL